MAQRRIDGGTDAARWLRRMVDFANADLGTMRAGDVLNLREDLDHFVLLGPGGVGGVAWPAPSQLSDEELAALQEKTRALLATVLSDADSAQVTAPGVATASASPIRIGEMTWHLIPASPLDGGPRRRLQTSGAPADVFQLQLLLVIGQYGTDRIKRCPRPECGRLFWKFGRRRYCSRQCTNAASPKVRAALRKNNAHVKRSEAAAARRRYERGVAKRAPGAKPRPYRPRAGGDR
jgi:hypothetical protein